MRDFILLTLFGDKEDKALIPVDQIRAVFSEPKNGTKITFTTEAHVEAIKPIYVEETVIEIKEIIDKKRIAQHRNLFHQECAIPQIAKVPLDLVRGISLPDLTDGRYIAAYAVGDGKWQLTENNSDGSIRNLIPWPFTRDNASASDLEKYPITVMTKEHVEVSENENTYYSL
jgi:hypothetical protein